MKKACVFFLFTLIFSKDFAFARKVNFENENFSGTVIYNETAAPGEAVFARMNIRIFRNSRRKNDFETKAVMQLIKDDKKIDSAKFYHLNSKTKRNSAPGMLASIPLSLWMNGGENFFLKIIFKTGATSPAKEIILPVAIAEKTWNQIKIDLDEKNSQLKKDMTLERLAQIEKSNDILRTVNENNVYSLKAFDYPVKNGIKSASCGDRRTYKYTNGKSEQSVHTGNDYDVPEGTEVFACADGKIVLAEFYTEKGWTIAIEHLPGLYSIYNHLSMLSVKEGISIKQGEKIGLSGSSGIAIEPHLHWEVILNNAAVDPEFFMQDFAFSSVE